MTKPQPDFQIRKATPADLPAIAAVRNAAQPGRPQTAQSLSNFLAELRGSERKPHCVYWLAEEGGQAVAAAQVWQAPWMFHPHRYHAELAVHPEHQHRGLGTRLAAVLREHLQERGAQEVLAGAYETAPHALRMLEARGFEEVMRFFDNVLDLNEVDYPALHPHRVKPEGAEVVSLSDLEQQWGKDAAWHAYYDCYRTVREDVPRTGAASPVSFESFRSYRLSRCGYPGHVALAAAGREVVGLSELWCDKARPERRDTGLTGTRREWRGRGVALALKAHCIYHAMFDGAAEIWTNNASTNVPMLALNEKLGFRPRPAYVECRWGSV